MTNQVPARNGYQSWDPNSIKRFIIRNVDYDTLNNVKIRLADHSDPDTKTLSRGEEIAFSIYNKNSLAYWTDVIVQQVDFNDGKSGDDLTCPGYNENPSDSGAVYYSEGDFYEEDDVGRDSKYDILSFKSYDFLLNWEDRDGIDKHPKASFSQAIEGDAIVMSIKRA